MATPIADMLLRLHTSIFTMTDMAKEHPAGSFERLRLMAKADALSESYEIAEAMLMGETQDNAARKYELIKDMIFTDFIDADIVLRNMGGFQNSPAHAKAVGTREGFAIAQDYLGSAIAG